MNIDIRNRLQRSSTIEVNDTKELMEFETYGSMGMISTLIDILVMIQERIKRGDMIKDAEDNEILTEKTFKNYVDKHFSTYVLKEMYKETKLLKDVYFSIENTEEGIDLIFSGNKPKKLFKWIANIDENYALVYLRENNVVYIQNRRTMDVTLFYSEHNNCYVYDKVEGKIKEVFN